MHSEEEYKDETCTSEKGVTVGLNGYVYTTIEQDVCHLPGPIVGARV